MQSTVFSQWRITREAEKKFRSGHPWIFSNELAQSPKGLVPGSPIELLDERGKFLARGYGHPNSLISFRVLSRDAGTVFDRDFFLNRFRSAHDLRARAGLAKYSHRLCFAEGDFLPGLIVDRFVLAQGQVFVVQSSTAGMDHLLEAVLAALEELANETGANWQDCAVIFANDSKMRGLEGLTVEPKKIVKASAAIDFAASEIFLCAADGSSNPVKARVDFIGGQKTGFFLDQRSNVEIAARLARQSLLAMQSEVKSGLKGRPFRVLDLFCYVGQWGTQLASQAHALGIECEVTLVDASTAALDLAAINVNAAGGKAIALKRDILDQFDTIPNDYFDVVICDPPAFVKKKKDLPTAIPAYAKLNRESLRKVRKPGLFISCSCSGLLTDEDFRAILAKAASAQRQTPRWVARGGHSADHPQLPEFPQGSYLKSWFALT